MVRVKLCQKCRYKFKFDSTRVDPNGIRLCFLGGAMTGAGRLCASCLTEKGKLLDEATAVDFSEVEVHEWLRGDAIVSITATARGVTFAVYADPEAAKVEGGFEVTRRLRDGVFDPKRLAEYAKALGLVPLDPGQFGARSM